VLSLREQVFDLLGYTGSLIALAWVQMERSHVL